MKIIILLSFMLASSLAYSDGSEGVGGGNPEELLHQGLGLSGRDQKRYAELFRSSKSQVSAYVLSEVKGWINLTTDVFQLLELSGNLEGVQTLNVIKSEIILGTLNRATLRISGEISETGPNGKKKRVLFSSNPANQTITVNGPYWNKIFSIYQLRSAERCFLKCNMTSVKQFISDAQKIDLALVATIFHEALVLNRYEGSRSYPVSSVFIQAVKANLVENYSSIRLPKSTLATQNLVKRFNSRLNYLDHVSLNPDYVAESIYTLTHVDMSKIRNGNAFMIKAGVADHLSGQAQCIQNTEEMSKLISEYLSLEESTSRRLNEINAAIARSTDPAEYDKLSIERSTLMAERMKLTSIKYKYDSLDRGSRCSDYALGSGVAL